MKNCNLRQKRLVGLTGAALGILLLASSALAAPPNAPATDPNFEIDANTADDAYSGDDWNNLYNNNTHQNPVAVSEQRDAQGNVVQRGILHDHAPASIFTGGGSKDIRDIPMWKWKDGAVPDKDDIEHAYAAAYASANNGGKDLIVYIGADRYSNDGDAMMGAWFFQDAVEAKSDGSFSGVHKNGDLLWLAHFSGGGSIAHMQGLVWNESGKANYKPNLNQVKGTNLAVLFTADPGASSVYVDGQYAAAVNTGNTPVPWDYVPKQGTPGTFPYNSFMEGGINISAFYRMMGMGDVPCFASFMIESRSSTEVNATLKDFVLGRLDTCRIDVKKSCLSSQLAADKVTIDHSYKFEVKNIGFGTIASVKLRDDMATPTNALDDRNWIYNGSIGAGGDWVDVTMPKPYIVNNTQNPPTNTVYAKGYLGSDATGFATAEVTSIAVCSPVTLSPKMHVEKACTETKLVAEGGKVVVKLKVAGKVCNDSPASDPNSPKLKNVTVTDPVLGTLLSGVTLMPEACQPYEKSYYPSAVAGDGSPAVQAWDDTVHATGEEAFSGAAVDGGYATATCKLCPTCP